MSKIAFLVLVCVQFLCAEDVYRYQHRFVLKKDEFGFMRINRKEVTKKPTADNPQNEYMLRLRWTLYTNQMLTLLTNYRGYPAQYILEKKVPLQSVVIPLLPVGANLVTSRTFAKIEFVDFNVSSKEATIDVSVADQESRIEVEFEYKKKK